ncbi:hypothetical protein ACN4EK_13100 [Pantanalinema rosaneae CENA516]|uniref:hypothetical protein n=1 Tax=Pantanalinema rosaneae TaxID=1620701 RepID=UPI003D6FB4DB
MSDVPVAAIISIATQSLARKVLLRLQTLCLHLRYLRLTLRDRPVLIQEQKVSLTQTKHKLLLISQHLEAIAEMVMVRFGQRRDRISHYHYQVLIELIQSMQHLVTSLIHLTDEYFIDPIGVQSCLETEIDADVLRMQQRLNQFLPFDFQLSSHQDSAA